MAKKNSSGLVRQDAFIKSIEGINFDFGLVLTQAFLKGIRDIGYKSTATALFESIDNSIQAEASNVHLLFDWDKGKSGSKEADRIAIVDDGYGMSREMVRVAVMWGGSDRLDDRQGMGKYGYGLPSSCVSIGESFTVVSKREDSDKWHSITMDLKEIAKRNPDYINPETGAIWAPPAKETALPAFVEKYFKEKDIKLTSGTVVIIEKIDRLSPFKLFSKLKPFLMEETGVTYRNYLRSVNIFVDGDKIEPIDPLFLTEGFMYHDEDEERAKALPSMEINIKGVGKVKARFSFMGPTFLRRPEFKMQAEARGSGKNNNRNRIRTENNGIIVCRAGRQIDVVTSKCPWTTFVNYDRYWGLELDFPPTLDEFFSITTSKQQIVIQDNVWDILKDNGLYSAIEGMRSMTSKALKENKRKLTEVNIESDEKPTALVEQIMAEVASEIEDDAEFIPQHIKKEAEEALDKEVEKKLKRIKEEEKITGISENVIRQSIEAEILNAPYTIEFLDEEEGPFFRPKQIGGQVVIYINRSHRFYSDLYENPKADKFFRDALSLLLFSVGIGELRVSEEKRKWYQQERTHWSIKLQSTLEKLSNYFSIHEDAKEFHEVNEDSIENNK